MVDQKASRKRAVDYGLPQYFDLQAKMGHTKHLGGVQVTRQLAVLCGLRPGYEVLNVGSGSGISAAYLVENFGCRLVGVDLLQGMVASAKKWAQDKGLSDQMEFHLGDAQDLPFDDNRFDALICESVNVFVPDKTKAMAEYVRVVKPGGHIAMTEAVWVKEPEADVAAIIQEATGQPFQPSEVWENLFKDVGLENLVFETHALSMRDEARNQSGLLSFGEYLRVVGRAIRFLLTDRENRSLIKYMSSNPTQYFDYMGYGVYAGKVP